MKIQQLVRKYCGKEEKSLLRSNFSSFPQYFQYISNFRSRITYTFVKGGRSIYVLLNSANLTCQGTDIAKYFRDSLRIRDNESRLYWYEIRDVLVPILHALWGIGTNSSRCEIYEVWIYGSTELHTLIVYPFLLIITWEQWVSSIVIKYSGDPAF